MIEAASNRKQTKESDFEVAIAEMWQRFSSLNGVVVDISVTRDKVPDCDIMFCQCKSSVTHAPLKEIKPEEYGRWETNYNYEGSTANVETTVAVNKFQRSIKYY